MGDQVLSLRWNNHQLSFIQKISNLYNKERFTDVTIACDEKFYPAHKFILSTCSEYFDKMFLHIDCKNPIIVLKDISQKNIEMLLNYMYLGEVNVDQSELPSLMKAAECLRIKGLAVSDVEEKPKKRKQSFEQHSMAKRRNAENNLSYDKKKSSSDKDNISIHSMATSDGNSTNKLQPVPTSDTKDFQKLLPVKKEKVDAVDDEYFNDATGILESTNQDHCTDVEPARNDSIPDDDFSSFSNNSFEPLPPDESDRNLNVSQQTNPTASAPIHYCPNCRYNTTIKCNMDKHKLVHTGERPFACRFCSYKTRQNGNLKLHIHRKHLDN